MSYEKWWRKVSFLFLYVFNVYIIWESWRPCPFTYIRCLPSCTYTYTNTMVVRCAIVYDAPHTPVHPSFLMTLRKFISSSFHFLIHMDKVAQIHTHVKLNLYSCRFMDFNRWSRMKWCVLLYYFCFEMNGVNLHLIFSSFVSHSRTVVIWLSATTVAGLIRLVRLASLFTLYWVVIDETPYKTCAQRVTCYICVLKISVKSSTNL